MQFQLEHRRHQRIEISRPVELLRSHEPTQGDQSIAGSTLNISNEGIAARFEKNLDVGELHPLLMHLEEGAPPVSKQARIVWCTPSAKGSGIDAGLALIASDAAHEKQASDSGYSSNTPLFENGDHGFDSGESPDEADDKGPSALAVGRSLSLTGENGEELRARVLSSGAGRAPGSIRLEIRLEADKEISKTEKDAWTLTEQERDETQAQVEEYRAGWVVFVERCVKSYIVPALVVLWSLAKRAGVAAVDLLRKSPPPSKDSGRLWDKVRLRSEAFRTAAWVSAVRAGHKVFLTASRIAGSRRNRRRPSRAVSKD